MTLAEHLAELRQRFMVIMICVSVIAVLGFIFYPHLLAILQNPYCNASPTHCKFLVTNPLDGLNLRVKIAFFAGIVISSPVILWEAWRFITPGLKARERRYAIPFVAASLIFFTAGMALAYFSFAQAIQWLEDIGGKTLLTEYNPNQYLTLFLLMLFIFGIAFLFPGDLRGPRAHQRRHAGATTSQLALRHDHHHDRGRGLHPEQRSPVDAGARGATRRVLLPRHRSG